MTTYKMKDHIMKRGRRTWAIKIEIGEHPETGKRRSKWHTVHGTKRHAERERNRLLGKVADESYVVPVRETVKDYLPRWLAIVGRKTRATTLQRYREIVEHHLIPTLGHHKLSKLKPIHISDAWANAIDNGRRDGKGGLSLQTTLHLHRVLSQALKAAVRLQIIAQNPCDNVDPPRPRRQEMTILSEDESALFLKAIEHTRIYLPALLALTTGMRRGEILGLRWRDVGLDNATLSVSQTLEHTKAGGLKFAPPKSARSRRQIALPALTVEALRRHKANQARELLALGIRKGEDGLVVCRRDGEPIQPMSITHEFTRLVANADMPRIRFHDLRHTHISHLLLSGVHPKVASERAGHASLRITLDTYSHVLPGLQEDAASRIDDLLRTAIERNRSK